MPATTEKIPEKIPFNVYAMLIILTFVFTGTATWMMGDELSKTWHYFDKKEEWPEKAVHITTINKDQEKYPENFELTDTDRKEWDKVVKSLYPKENIEFPEKDYEWPAGFDPLQYAIQRDGDNLTASKDRPDMEKQFKALMTLDKGGTPASSTTPPAEAPKTDAPKTDAPKADAPKADAPKADEAPKADK
jgi:hypothetical protein